MSGFVLDASVAVAWLFDDESDPRAEIVLTRLKNEQALVPQHWMLEVRNSLLVGERRARIRADEVDERLTSLRALPLRTDSEPGLDVVFALARTHRLSIYDAIYLELAKRTGLALATLDDRLRQAALNEGLALVK
ncbi:MAG: type II toxin-antitoxin system VapC family toxin [Acidobacteriota bacterium]|nr:type II toxin-antitoxin system VapC family toxin [Acidobacteriota bacterium]